MASYTWTGAAGDDNWSNPANWSPQGVPGAGDTASISPAAATAIGVGGITVGAITDNANVTLTVANNSSFALGAGGAKSSTTFSNGGTLAISSAGNTTNFILNDTTTTLSGGGRVQLSDNTNNRIYSGPGGGTLINVDNTIAGAGQIGLGQTIFVNQAKGVVDATSATNALILQMSAPIQNSGLLESTGAGGLVIQSTVVNQTSGGTISAAGKTAVVVLTGATVEGGTLITSGGGLIETGGGNAGLDGTLAAVANKGTLAVTNNTTLNLAGIINNTGIIQENAGANTTNIQLTYPSVTLTGGGTLVLSNSGNNRIYGAVQGYTLTNVNNTISGAGQIGVGQMVLVNEAKGVIDANQTTGITLQTNNLITNAGLIEATGTGGLQIVSSNIDNAGGTISASGAGAHVDLINGSTIEGGTVSTSNGGVIDTGNTGGLDGLSHGALTLNGMFSVTNNTQLNLAGTINNTGTIAENAGVNTTTILLTSPTVTLTGGGKLTLSNSDANRIYGASAAYTLVNVNNVISGSGQLGDAQMTLINQAGGVIDATNAPITQVSSGVLTINCNGGVTNAGLIEDTGTAGLVILNTNVDNAGGTITAIGAGSLVTLSATNIEGGLVTDSAGGSVFLVNGTQLDGSEPGIGAVTIGGTVQVANNNTAYLAGTINNTGTLSVNSAGSTTDLRLSSSVVTLTGGGKLTLSANVNNRIYGNVSNDTLDNVNNTIVGAGQLGASQMHLINEAAGIIDGNTTTGLNVDCNAGITNLGLIESTANGGLTISNTVVMNAGGTISAVGANNNLTLSASAIEGGVLTTSGGGVIFAVNNTTLDGFESGTGVLTNAGSLQVVNNNDMNLAGTINNTGTINLDSMGNNTDLRLSTETVTLTGGGTLLLSDNANNRVYGNASYFTLDNVNNTISGAGQLGVSTMALINTGTIDANGTNALILDTGSYGVTNGAGGLIEATGAGGLSFNNGVLSNSGEILASGGNVTFGNNVVNLNSVGGTLTGGTWAASGGSTLSITGGAVAVDAATLILNGAGSTIQAGSGGTFVNLGASLTTIAAGGSLDLGAKAALSVSALSLSDLGQVALQGGTLTAKSLAIGASGTLTGFGTDKGAAVDNGTILATGGTLSITGNVSGKGTVQIANNATASIGGKDTVASIVFAGGGTETLALVKPAGSTSVISGFAAGDVIDLTKTAATSLSYSGNTTSGTLTVKNGTTTVAALKFAGNYTTASFALASDGGTGVKITETGSPAGLHAAASGMLPDFGLGALPEQTALPSPTESGAHIRFSADTFEQHLWAAIASHQIL